MQGYHRLPVLAVPVTSVQNSLEEQDMSPECKTEVMKDQNRMAQVRRPMIVLTVDQCCHAWRLLVQLQLG